MTIILLQKTLIHPKKRSWTTVTIAVCGFFKCQSSSSHSQRLKEMDYLSKNCHLCLSEEIVTSEMAWGWVNDGRIYIFWVWTIPLICDPAVDTDQCKCGSSCYRKEDVWTPPETEFKHFFATASTPTPPFIWLCPDLVVWREMTNLWVSSDTSCLQGHHSADKDLVITVSLHLQFFFCPSKRIGYASGRAGLFIEPWVTFACVRWKFSRLERVRCHPCCSAG